MGSNMASTSNAASHASKAAAKNQTGMVFKCFKCGEAGHKAADCKKPMLSQGKTLMIDDCEDQEDDNQPVYNMETGAEIRGDEQEEEGMALMMKKTLLEPEKEEEKDWVRSRIFHSSCNIGGKVCSLIIDGGSCENVIAQEVVDKLVLKTQDHPQPYKLSWLKIGNAIEVTKQCLVLFSIGKKFEDQVLCDVVQINVCHLLLGRPWQYDRGTCHDGKRNTYSLKQDGKLITLLPMRKKVFSNVH